MAKTAVKWKRGTGYGLPDGGPHLVSSDGKFEIFKGESSYRVVSIDNEFGYTLFVTERDAKAFVNAWLGVRKSFFQRWSKVIRDL